MKCFVVLLISLLLSYYLIADNYLTRGHQPNELFISSTWFTYVDTATTAIFYSDNNGESISLRYYYAQNSSGMPIGKLVTDKTTGVIYNDASTTLWRTDDGGYTWTCLPLIQSSGFYSSGSSEGALFGRFPGNLLVEPGLYLSNNYGNTYEYQSDSVYGFLEVGVIEECIYYYYGPNSYHDLTICFSDDLGLNFSTISVLNSTIGGNYTGYNLPSLSRGTSEGELYLTTLFNNNIFKVFHSIDNGQSFELRYESPTCNFYLETYSFTAGKKPGSFYYSKMIPLYQNTANTLLCIYYSNDTAKTFTEYCHVLDTGFPVNIIENHSIEQKSISFFNYPNPFTNTTTLKFDNIEPGNYTIEVTSLSGQAVLRKEEYLDMGDKQVQLNTSSFSPGVYLCAIKQNGQVVGVQKMIKR